VVERTFRLKQLAWNYENGCNSQVTIRIIPGLWKKNDVIRFGTPTFSLFSYAEDRRNVNA
jgi:hypothetical protein